MSRRNNLTPEGIIRTLEVHRERIKGFGVKRIGLFGSFLKGTPHRRSDIDLLVTFHKPTFDNYMGLKFFLERVLGKKVDLVIEDNLKPGLEYVKKEALYVGVAQVGG